MSSTVKIFIKPWKKDSSSRTVTTSYFAIRKSYNILSTQQFLTMKTLHLSLQQTELAITQYPQPLFLLYYTVRLRTLLCTTQYLGQSHSFTLKRNMILLMILQQHICNTNKPRDTQVNRTFQTMKIIICLISAVLLIAAAVLIDTHYKRKNKRTETVKLHISQAYSYLHKITYESLSLEGLYCVFREIIHDLDISFILSPYGIFRAKSLDDCRMSDIYLGNIYGLWTMPLNYWVKSTDKEAVDIVTTQFKETLIDTLNTYIKNEKSK